MPEPDLACPIDASVDPNTLFAWSSDDSIEFIGTPNVLRWSLSSPSESPEIVATLAARPPAQTLSIDRMRSSSSRVTDDGSWILLSVQDSQVVYNRGTHSVWKLPGETLIATVGSAWLPPRASINYLAYMTRIESQQPMVPTPRALEQFCSGS